MQYSDRIRLDRYAAKDPFRELDLDDMVVVSVPRTADDGRTIESREIGYVERDGGEDGFDIRMDGTDEVLEGVARSRLDYVVEQSFADVCHRVAAGAVAQETDDNGFSKDEFQEALDDALVQERLVAAGRIYAGLGRPDLTLTYFSCYVYAILQDSRHGIMDHAKRLADTYAQGGGVGWNLSILRPRGAVVKKVNGRSSGSVSWGNFFSNLTGMIEQGGSRRGAAWQGLDCWHPDILEFIQAKSLYHTKITQDGSEVSVCQDQLVNSNVSVLISDAFMRAVEDDLDWELVFPDLQDPDYDDQWDGDLAAWRDADKPVVVYRTIRARELWQRIAEAAWASGEPGLIFIDQANRMSNSYYFSTIRATNPCSEQMLPANSCCNLSHLNLPKFIKSSAEQLPPKSRTADEAAECFDWDLFQETIGLGVRMLDNITDLNRYHDTAVKKQQLSERRIGLGILGYGDLLIRLGLRYGSDDALQFTDRLMKQLAFTAYRAGIALAQERGPFPTFKPEFTQSGYCQRLKEGKQLGQLIINDIEEHGIRCCTFLTAAPTGSVAAVVRTSGGIEPLMDFTTTQITRVGIGNETLPVVQQLIARYGEKRRQWPDYCVTAMRGISPEQHVRTLAAVQRWIDAGVSKTVNCPADATVADIERAYRLMWFLGCKGGTVYRDGCRDHQVIYSAEPPQSEAPAPEAEPLDDEDDLPETSVLSPKLDVGVGPIMGRETPVGTLHLGIRHDPHSGEPSDVFLFSGKGDVAADVQAISRLISVILRWPNGKRILQTDRLRIVQDQLADIPGRSQTGFGEDSVVSMPDGVAKMLGQYLDGDYPGALLPFGQDQLLELLAEAETDPDRAVDLLREMLIGNGDKKAATLQPKRNGHRDYCGKCGVRALVIQPNKCNYCESCGFSSCG